MLRALAAGALLALAAAPTNLWPFAIAGMVLLFTAVDHPSWRRRMARAFVAAAVLFVVTLRWTSQFNVAGSVALVLGEALLVAVMLLLVPAHGRRGKSVVGRSTRAAAFVAAVTASELVRITVPFGGFQLGGFATGMAGSPLAPSVAVLGETGLVMVTALCAVALVNIIRRPRVGVAALVAVVVVVAVGSIDLTRASGRWEVATVQAGGPQALLRDQQDPDRVFLEHLQLAQQVEGTEAIVWPENVLSVDGPVEQSGEGAAVSALAQQKGAFVGVGVVESADNSRFRNSFVVWSPEGRVVDRYEKVLRVPFGEYVPGRHLIERVADLSQVPSDAFVGKNTATVRMGKVQTAVAISYEGLFSRRIRDGVGAGGEVVLIPTNAASYESTRVSRTQVQAARLRALESGRAVVQAAPTGISAMVSADGDVQQQARIGTAAIQKQTVELREGETLFTKWGHIPLVALSSATLIATWGFLLVRRRRDRDLPHDAQTADG